jgi:hypothetical protein
MPAFANNGHIASMLAQRVVHTRVTPGIKVAVQRGLIAQIRDPKGFATHAASPFNRAYLRHQYGKYLTRFSSIVARDRNSIRKQRQIVQHTFVLNES